MFGPGRELIAQCRKMCAFLWIWLSVLSAVGMVRMYKRAELFVLAAGAENGVRKAAKITAVMFAAVGTAIILLWLALAPMLF